MPKLARNVLLCLLALLASGCSQNLPAIVDTGAMCRDWRTIKPTSREIKSIGDETAKQILDNNLSRDVWCEDKPA